MLDFLRESAIQGSLCTKAFYKLLQWCLVDSSILDEVEDKKAIKDTLQEIEHMGL